MRLLDLPAVMPAVAALSGAAFVASTDTRSLPLLSLLLAFGVALRRPVGWWVACLAAGALSAALQIPPPDAFTVDPERPVEAQVALLTPWKSGAYGWSSLARIEEMRQGNTPLREPVRVWLQIGSRESPPPTAGRLRVRGYLGRRQAFRNDPTIPPGTWHLTVKSRRLLQETGGAGLLLRSSRLLRDKVEGALDSFSQESPVPALGLLRSLLLGDRSQLPGGWLRALRRCGLGHVLAISGLHTGLILLFAVGVGRLFPRYLRIPWVLLVLGLFVLLVGPRPSVLRAATMALLAYAALLVGRPPTAVNALACFVLGTVALEPAVVTELGFRLSISATVGLLVLAPKLAAHWSAYGSAYGSAHGSLPRRIALPLAAAFSAQVATLPFSVPVFSLMHPLSVVFNLLGLPWIAVFLAAGILWVFLALLFPPWAAATLPVLEVLAAPAAALERLPAHAAISLPVVSGFAGALALAVLLLLAGRWPGKIGLPALALAFVLGSWGGPPADPQLVVFDVGQGDAILLRSAGRTLLIDGGGALGGGIGDRVLLPALRQLGIRRLDAVALTHPDADHCDGLLELADYLPIDTVFSPSRWRSSECVRHLEETRRISWRGWNAGRIEVVGEWRLEGLSPEAEGRDVGHNDGSLVLLAQVRGIRVLLTGDLESSGEKRLLARFRKLLSSDILKVGHHGSKTSTSERFLRAVDPRWALISAGSRNRFRHPHEQVTELLGRHRVRTLRTDIDGGIYLSIGPGGEIRHGNLPELR